MPINVGQFNVDPRKATQLNAAAEQGSDTVKDIKKITKEGEPIKAEPVDVKDEKDLRNRIQKGTIKEGDVIRFNDGSTWVITDVDEKTGDFKARGWYPEGYVCGGQGLV